MADERLIVVDRFKAMLQAYRPVHPASCDCPACTWCSRPGKRAPSASP